MLLIEGVLESHSWELSYDMLRICIFCMATLYSSDPARIEGFARFPIGYVTQKNNLDFCGPTSYLYLLFFSSHLLPLLTLPFEELFSGNVGSAKIPRNLPAYNTVEKMEQTRISTSTTIDLRGDVRLILDEGTLKVSRKALCLSSPVFLAMLGEDSRFWEASDKAIREDGVRDVPLRDDDFGTMEILMRIIHLQNGAVPTKVSFQQLGEIAMVCDKYALRNCIVPWALLWSQPYLDSIEKDGYESWLFISIVFRNEDAFTRITKHLILNTTVSSSGILTKGNTVIGEGVPDDIVGKTSKQAAMCLINPND